MCGTGDTGEEVRTLVGTGCSNGTCHSSRVKQLVKTLRGSDQQPVSVENSEEVGIAGWQAALDRRVMEPAGEGQGSCSGDIRGPI
jgi:hypothetical protein